MKKCIFISSFLCLIAAKAFCQADTSFISSTIKNLRQLAVNSYTEKAYLQFDKPYYAAGDTVYFKAYVTAGPDHRLSNVSGLLHVDLIDPKDKVKSFILLQLVNGMARGDFALQDSIAAGSYRVRAYTQFMQGNGYFDRQVFIASNTDRISESVTPAETIHKADLQFFPEGGTMVNDVRGKIAFKATGTDGLGTYVNGQVLDNFNKVITTFTSTHAGMGNFSLIPEEGHAYRVKYKTKDSVAHTLSLPLAQKKGIALSVSTTNPALINISVLANRPYYLENKGKNYLVTVYDGNKLTYVRSKLDSYELDVRLPVTKFQSGVARVTLLTNEGTPLCERLVFIKNTATDISPVLTTDKVAYSQREEVKVNVTNANISPDRSGYFSASVINEDRIPSKGYGSSIYADILLTSEIKGFIEDPDYYFAINDDKARADLNNLLLTQGYRKFSWKELPALTAEQSIPLPERSLTISGVVRTLNDKAPVANGTVNLLSPHGGPLLTTQTDSMGRFKFAGILVADTARLMLTATNGRGRDNTLIRLDRPAAEAMVEPLNMPNVPVPDMQTYLQSKMLEKTADAAYSPPKGKLLKEVKIQALRSSNIAGAGHADQAIDFRTITQRGRLSDILNGRLHGISFYGDFPMLNGPHSGPMNVVVDGVFMDQQIDTTGRGESALSSIDPNTVETVEVLKYASASIYGMNSGNGVIVITTKNVGSREYDNRPATGILSFNPHGVYIAREFYSPKYLPDMPVSAKPDLRSTIYWKPDLKTDDAGLAHFNYYNADGSGHYKITLEGIDNNGNLAHTVYRYIVK